jgi:hypothetical protein
MRGLEVFKQLKLLKDVGLSTLLCDTPIVVTVTPRYGHHLEAPKTLSQGANWGQPSLRFSWRLDIGMHLRSLRYGPPYSSKL